VRVGDAADRGHEGSNPMKYAIVITAILSDSFYIYVLIQLRREEKRHSLRESHLKESTGGVLDSYTAVRTPGQSFAHWPRLINRRNVPEPGGAQAGSRKPVTAASKMRQISHIELPLTLSSRVAPVTEDGSRDRVTPIKKKSAWPEFSRR
jgi:hypothetical protein